MTGRRGGSSRQLRRGHFSLRMETALTNMARAAPHLSRIWSRIRRLFLALDSRYTGCRLKAHRLRVCLQCWNWSILCPSLVLPKRRAVRGHGDRSPRSDQLSIPGVWSLPPEWTKPSPSRFDFRCICLRTLAGESRYCSRSAYPFCHGQSRRSAEVLCQVGRVLYGDGIGTAPRSGLVGSHVPTSVRVAQNRARNCWRGISKCKSKCYVSGVSFQIPYLFDGADGATDGPPGSYGANVQLCARCWANCWKYLSVCCSRAIAVFTEVCAETVLSLVAV